MIFFPRDVHPMNRTVVPIVKTLGERAGASSSLPVKRVPCSGGKRGKLWSK